MKAIIPILAILLASCASDPSPFYEEPQEHRTKAEAADTADIGISLNLEAEELEEEVMNINL